MPGVRAGPSRWESWQWAPHHGIFGSRQQSSGGHASSGPHAVAMTPGALPSGASPTLSLMAKVRREQAECPSTVSRSLGVPRAKKPQAGPEAGPSPGVPVLSARLWGWAAAAAPPGTARTR